MMIQEQQHTMLVRKTNYNLQRDLARTKSKGGRIDNVKNTYTADMGDGRLKQQTVRKHE